MAARNSNGLVVAQVERIAADGSLDARDVVVPGVLVDCVVVAPPEEHRQTYGTAYNAAFAGEIRIPLDSLAAAPLDERKIVARRCAFELPLGGVINLGIGLPEVLAAVAAEERVLEHLTLTAEPGVIGGMPQGGLDFGAAVNTQALLHQNQQFDFYDGGGLDLACLGMAEVDRLGNVNVSASAAAWPAPGASSTSARTRDDWCLPGHSPPEVWMIVIDHGPRAHRQRRAEAQVRRLRRAGHVQRCSRSSAGAVGAVRDGALRLFPGQGRSSPRRSSARRRHRAGHPSQMDFRPHVGDVTEMDARIFGRKPMQLFDTLLDLRLVDRLTYDAERNTLFANFEAMAIRSQGDIESVRRVFTALCKKIGHKVALVANYDGFRLDESLSDAYFEMVSALQSKYYTTAVRYTTSAFMRMKLGTEAGGSSFGRARLRNACRGDGIRDQARGGELRWTSSPRSLHELHGKPGEGTDPSIQAP
jgi:propionate CoA-transferase